MIMEAKKLCNLLSSSQRPRKASGVVQRPEWQRVHSVECSPVWRPENQDCRGQTVVPDLIHTGGRRSMPDLVHAAGADGRARPCTRRGQTVSARPRTRRGQTVGADGRARPRTRRGQMVSARPRNAGGRRSCQTSYTQAEQAFNFPPRRALLRPHRLGWRPPTLKGLLLRGVQQFTCWYLPEPRQTQPEIMSNQLFMHLLASLIKLTCKINHHSRITKYSAFFFLFLFIWRIIRILFWFVPYSSGSCFKCITWVHLKIILFV